MTPLFLFWVFLSVLDLYDQKIDSYDYKNLQSCIYWIRVIPFYASRKWAKKYEHAQINVLIQLIEFRRKEKFLIVLKNIFVRELNSLVW